MSKSKDKEVSFYTEIISAVNFDDETKALKHIRNVASEKKNISELVKEALVFSTNPELKKKYTRSHGVALHLQPLINCDRKAEDFTSMQWLRLGLFLGIILGEHEQSVSRDHVIAYDHWRETLDEEDNEPTAKEMFFYLEEKIPGYDRAITSFNTTYSRWKKKWRNGDIPY